MKFRQKLYFFTLILFVIIFNLSLLFIVNMVYQNSLSLEKEKSFNEADYIAKTLIIDYSNKTSSIAEIISSYATVYANNETFLALYQNNNELFNNLPLSDITKKLPPSTDNSNSLLHRENGVPYFCISFFLPTPLQNYKLFYVHALTSLENAMLQLAEKCLLISVAGIIFLSISLFFMLRHLISPLNKLTFAAASIADGNYDKKAEIRGNDEITELSLQFNKMADEIEKRVSSLQTFIDNISHEMRTPLTSIRGYAEYVLLSASTEEERYRSLQYIITESTRLSQMSNRLLLLSKIKSGTFESEPFLFSTLLSQIKKTLSFSFDEKRITFTHNIQVEEFNGDFLLMESLLQNLLENAIHACFENGCISLVVFPISVGIQIEIEDNGRGIDKADLLHITEPFYRTDKARSRIEGGSGIGLALCHAIVNSFGGKMYFSSKLSKGTKVTLIFTT